MAPGPITVTKISANQVVQRDDGSVPLVEGKGTWVRVFLKSLSGDVAGVDGTLKVSEGGGNTQTYQPQNGPITVDGSASRAIAWAHVDLRASAAHTPFAAEPAWLSQPQTDNGPDLTRTRQRDTAADGMQLALEETELKAGSGHTDETVGWLAVERGSGTAGTLSYEAGRTWLDESVTGGLAMVEPPGSFAVNSVEDDDNALLVREAEGITTIPRTKQPVDFTQPGVYDAANLPGGTVDTSNLVNSHFIHFDPAGTSANQNLTASVTFEHTVRGVIGSQANLNATDGDFGFNDLVKSGSGDYSTGSTDRDIDTGDAVTLSKDGRTLTLDLQASSGADQLRVLTDAGADKTNVPFDQSYGSDPTFLATPSSYRGDDPAGLRTESVSSDAATVTLDEDKTADNETGHVNETVDYLTLGGSGTITGYTYTPDTLPGDTITSREIVFDNPQNSGMVTSGGLFDPPFQDPIPLDRSATLASKTDSLPVGDLANQPESHALFEFELDGLPDDIAPADIKNAKLTLTFDPPNGNPRFTEISAVHAYHGDTVDPDDYRGVGNLTVRPGFAGFPADPKAGAEVVDVTRAVKDAISFKDATDPIQFAVYAKGIQDNRTADNYPILTGQTDGTNRPALDISYEDPLLEPQTIGETGTVTGLTDSVQTVSLTESYTDPAVFAQPASNNGADPVAVEVDNVQSDSFEISLGEPGGSAHGTGETVDYAVIESGSWQLKDGTHIEAGTTKTDVTAGTPGEHTDGTLNFFIPGGDSDGTLTLDPSVSAPSAKTSGDLSETVTFEPRDDYVIPFIDVHYTNGSFDDRPDGDAPTDLAGGDSFIARTFPTDTVTIDDTGREITVTKDLSVDSNWVEIRNKLALMEATSVRFPPFVPYAIIPDDADSLNGLNGIHWPGTVVGDIMTGVEDRDATLAHEVGHRLGLPHAPQGNPDNRDPDYPLYTDASGTAYRYASIGGVGLDDGGGLQAIDPRTNYDFMSYAGDANTWMSAYNYQRLYDTLGPPSQNQPLTAGPSGDGEPTLHITGSVNAADGGATLNTGFVLPGGRSGEEPADGAYALETRGRDGRVLESRPIQPGKGAAVSTAPADIPDRPFAVSIPVSDEVASVAVVDDAGEPLATNDVSSNAPAAGMAGLADAGDILSEARALRIGAEDADGDAVFKILQFSPDGGSTWESVNVGLTGDTAVVDPARLPATQNGTFRVLASDGLNTDAAAMNGTIAIPNSAPEAAIDRVVANGERAVILRGGASDIEDDRIDGDSLQWRSDLDGALGTGREIRADNLSSGTHALTLTATDGDGAADTATRTLRVGETGETARGPVAKLQAEPDTPRPREQVTLDASESTAGDAQIAGYRFDREGDGTFDTGVRDAPTVTFTYANPGTVSPRVQVVDASGLRAAADTDVPVVAPAPASDGPPSGAMLNILVATGDAQTLRVPFDADIRGSSAAETIRAPAGVTLEIGGNAGDEVELAADAAAYDIAASGNTLTLTNGGTQVTVALNAAVDLSFADGTASARVALVDGTPTVTLSGKAVTAGFDPAAVDLDTGERSSLAGGEGGGDNPAPAATPNILVLNGAPQSVTVPFAADVRGTAAAETVSAPTGTAITFGGNSGDAVELADTLASYSFVQRGNVLGMSGPEGTDVDIALNAGVDVRFTDGTATAELVTGEGAPSIELGGEPVGPAFDPAAVTLQSAEPSPLVAGDGLG